MGLRSSWLSASLCLGMFTAACGGGSSSSSGGGAGGSGGSVPVEARPEGVALCYTQLADEHPATLAFWEALLDGNREARGAAIEGLAAAVEEHPEEEELALLLGLAHLWRVAEPLPSEVGDQASFVQSALAAKSNLEKAYMLCPTDHRIPAWLGVMQVNMGRALNNQEAIDEGLATLQKGIDHYPSFVLFSKLLVFADRPASDPDFQKALDAVAENVDACALTPHDPACLDTPHAAHNIEGSMVFLGDVFAKAGKREEALAFYQRSKVESAYASWPFQSLLEERVATIDARIEASSDADPKNDPEMIWASTLTCAVCHTR
jgi:tetratricopeptide (TPR) repeat protein